MPKTTKVKKKVSKSKVKVTKPKAKASIVSNGKLLFVNDGIKVHKIK